MLSNLKYCFPYPKDYFFCENGNEIVIFLIPEICLNKLIYKIFFESSCPAKNILTEYLYRPRKTDKDSWTVKQWDICNHDCEIRSEPAEKSKCSSAACRLPFKLK